MVSRWAQTSARVKEFQAKTVGLFPKLREFVVDSKRRRVYFIGVNYALNARHGTLFYVDLDPAINSGVNSGMKSAAFGVYCLLVTHS